MDIEGYGFDEPEPLGSGFTCPCEGVYVILCPVTTFGDVQDEDANIYVVLYVGESEDVNRRVRPGHQKWECFHDECDDPHVAFHRMPRSTQAERQDVEEELIEAFSPTCNK